MGKYEALTEWLIPQIGGVQASFDHLDRIVPGGLPNSARHYREWWANTRSNPQARAWLNAGRVVEGVNLTAETVHFTAAAQELPSAHESTCDAGPTQKSGSPQQGDPRREWYWEGNVQATMVDHLVARGWSIVSAADTATKEAGIDILVERAGHRMAVEVKGYPSDRYVSGRRRGEKMPTRPPVQARHWYASALLTTLLTKEAHSDWTLALALPDFPTYRRLLERTASSLSALDIDAYLVSEGWGVVRHDLG